MMPPAIIRPPVVAQPFALAQPSAWRVEQRTGSGQYIVSEHSALLARIDRASATMFLYDKKTRAEVPVRLTDLLALCRLAT